MQVQNSYALVGQIDQPDNQIPAQDACPSSTFPLDEEVLMAYGFAPLKSIDEYQLTDTQFLRAKTPVYDQVNNRIVTYNVVNFGAAELAERKVLALGQKYISLVSAGFTFESHVYQIDDASALAMSIVKQQIKDGLPGLGYWRSKDNKNISMNDTKVVELINAAYTYGAGLKNTLWTKLNAVVAANTADAVNAVSVDSGW